MIAALSRRDFLKANAIALGTAAFSYPDLLEAATVGAANKRGLRKAVNLGMVKGSESILEKFKLLKELGFDGVELNYPNGPDKPEVLKARDATGIVVANIIDSVHWHKPLSDPSLAVRAEGLAGLEESLRDAKELGCPTVLLVPAVVKKDVSYDQAYTRSQAEIRKATPLAEKLGVKIAIENVWNQFLLSPLEAARYVDEFNSPAVAWHFDVGNIINYGWPEQWVRILGKRIVTLHIKEFSRDRRDKEGLWKGFEIELLDGSNDWPAVMRALDEIGFKGWSVAEIPGGDASRLKTIAERMDRIFDS